MKLFSFQSLFIGLLCSLAISAYAQTSDLYTAQVPVASVQDADRELAIQQAFAQVLVKLSGNSAATQLSTADAKLWVQQYRYEEMKQGDTVVTLLDVSFDPKAVDQFLKRNHASVWAGARPLTIVFMAVEENGAQAIVGEYESTLTHWQQQFVTDTKARGLPVIFPLLDLTDKAQVSVNDVWYHASDKLQPIATRYQATQVLSGRIYQNLSTQMWASDWLLTIGSDQMSWQQTAATPDELIKDSVNRFADEVTKRATIQPASTAVTDIDLLVDNVNDTQTYLRLYQYLQGLDGVAAVMPTHLLANQATFTLKLQTESALLQQRLTTDNVLQALPQTSSHILHYRML